MTSSYEIRQTAIKVKDVYGEIDRRRAKTLTAARESALWWKGAGSDAFSHEYARIDGEIKKLLDTFETLERRLKTVANAIDEWEALLAAEAAAAAAAAESSKVAAAAATEAANAVSAAAAAIASAINTGKKG